MSGYYETSGSSHIYVRHNLQISVFFSVWLCVCYKSSLHVHGITVWYCCTGIKTLNKFLDNSVIVLQITCWYDGIKIRTGYIQWPKMTLLCICAILEVAPILLSIIGCIACVILNSAILFSQTKLMLGYMQLVICVSEVLYIMQTLNRNWVTKHFFQHLLALFWD